MWGLNQINLDVPLCSTSLGVKVPDPMGASVPGSAGKSRTCLLSWEARSHWPGPGPPGPAELCKWLISLSALRASGGGHPNSTADEETAEKGGVLCSGSHGRARLTPSLLSPSSAPLPTSLWGLHAGDPLLVSPKADSSRWSPGSQAAPASQLGSQLLPRNLRLLILQWIEPKPIKYSISQSKQGLWSTNSWPEDARIWNSAADMAWRPQAVFITPAYSVASGVKGELSWQGPSVTWCLTWLLFSLSPKYFPLSPQKAKTNSHLTYFGKHEKYLYSFPPLKLWSGPFHSVVTSFNICPQQQKWNRSYNICFSSTTRQKRVDGNNSKKILDNNFRGILDRPNSVFKVCGSRNYPLFSYK